MARLTIEECLQHVPNRFDLILLAGKRARQLMMGAEPLVEVNNDKPTVIALREIEAGLVTEENIEVSTAEEDMMEGFAAVDAAAAEEASNKEAAEAAEAAAATAETGTETDTATDTDADTGGDTGTGTDTADDTPASS